MRIQYAVVSKDGGRKVNEDSVLVKARGGSQLFALADGLGGHGMGEVASGVAVNSLAEAFADAALTPEEALGEGMERAQQALRRLQSENRRPNDYKTTLVALIIEGGEAHFAHIGDSRLYRFEGSKISERTLDHSVPQMLVIQGEIKERDIRFHEDRNRLTRVLGMDTDSLKFSRGEPVAISAPAAFLLCSDGFWELLDEDDMRRTLKKSAGADKWLAEMTEMVERAGRGRSMDNYSAVAVLIS